MLILISGLPGSGKSTNADALIKGIENMAAAEAAKTHESIGGVGDVPKIVRDHTFVAAVPVEEVNWEEVGRAEEFLK